VPATDIVRGYQNDVHAILLNGLDRLVDRQIAAYQPTASSRMLASKTKRLPGTKAKRWPLALDLQFRRWPAILSSREHGKDGENDLLYPMPEIPPGSPSTRFAAGPHRLSLLDISFRRQFDRIKSQQGPPSLNRANGEHKKHSCAIFNILLSLRQTHRHRVYLNATRRARVFASRTTTHAKSAAQDGFSVIIL